MACFDTVMSLSLPLTSAIYPPSHQLDAWFFKISPKGEVPVLVHGDKITIGTVNILKYIDEHFEGPKLKLSDARVEKFIALHEAIDVNKLICGFYVKHNSGAHPLKQILCAPQFPTLVDLLSIYLLFVLWASKSKQLQRHLSAPTRCGAAPRSGDRTTRPQPPDPARCVRAPCLPPSGQGARPERPPARRPEAQGPSRAGPLPSPALSTATTALPATRPPPVPAISARYFARLALFCRTARRRIAPCGRRSRTS